MNTGDRLFPHLWMLESLLYNTLPDSEFYKDTHADIKQDIGSTSHAEKREPLAPALPLSQATTDNVENGWYYTDDDEDGGVILDETRRSKLVESPYLATQESDISISEQGE